MRENEAELPSPTTGSCSVVPGIARVMSWRGLSSASSSFGLIAMATPVRAESFRYSRRVITVGPPSPGQSTVFTTDLSGPLAAHHHDEFAPPLLHPELVAHTGRHVHALAFVQGPGFAVEAALQRPGDDDEQRIEFVGLVRRVAVDVHARLQPVPGGAQAFAVVQRHRVPAVHQAAVAEAEAHRVRRVGGEEVVPGRNQLAAHAAILGPRFGDVDIHGRWIAW